MKKIILASTLLVAFTAASASHAAEEPKSYTSEGGVAFIPNKGVTPPTDPNEPGGEVTPGPEVNPPGTSGPLSIDFASSLNFGTNLITSKNQVYVARAQGLMDKEAVGDENAKPKSYRPNYVQVTDNRGTNSGWTLKVKQNGQFFYEDTLNQELKGSAITFTEATPNSQNIKSVTKPDVLTKFTLDPKGAETIVMSAQDKSGAGTWVDYFGSKLEDVTTVIEDNEDPEQQTKIDEVVNPAITLAVPGTTPKDAVKYTTSFTWTLSDVPGQTIVQPQPEA